MTPPQEGDLKVWWIPQVPGKPFEVPILTREEGKRLLATLAAYDLFQLLHNIKPDYSNVGGLMVYCDGEWEDCEDDDA